MNYFSLITSDDGSEFMYEGDPMVIVRNLGQIVADDPIGCNLLVAIAAQALYCNNQISEAELEEIISTTEDRLICNFDEFTELWFEQED